MTAPFAAASPRLKARIAGVLYLITIATGVFSLSVRSAVTVRGDAAATATKILTSELSYRFGFVADLVAGMCYIGVIVILYGLLKSVSRTISLLAAVLGSAGCVVGAALSADLLAPLILLRDAPYLAAFTTEQLQAQALTSVRSLAQASSIAFVYFGAYCILLGYLVFRSTFLPRVLGILVAVAGLGWLANSFASLLAPAFAPHLSRYIMVSGGLGEGSLCLWLIVFGVNVPRWEKQAGAVDRGVRILEHT